MNFSKTKYVRFRQCPKMLWLDKNEPDAATRDSGTAARMAAGNDVGDLAMGLFGEYEDVTVKRGDELDIVAMTERTRALIDAGAENICEASFIFDGLYCAVDILHKESGGYGLYEVKSSTHVKDVYIIDAAYQKYVARKCGVNVTRACIVNINTDYVLDGALDIKKLFKITDVTERVDEAERSVESDLIAAESTLLCASEPNIRLHGGCNSPYPCEYFDHCLKRAGIPRPSVFDLHRLGFAKKLELYGRGLIDFRDIKNSGENIPAAAARQLEHELGTVGDTVDVRGIREFLRELYYPLYFLDFETMQLTVPEYAGTRPYEQIPFLYSLHYIEKAGGEVRHTDFLAEPGSDPQRAIAERLVADIPRGACVLAYNMSFEKGRIATLAQRFPEFSERLNEIAGGMRDLMIPFSSGMYYTREMHGSASIKSVLPAIAAGDPRLDYHALDGVHNGVEAKEIYPQLRYMPPRERERAIENLKKYCELDTLAMVVLWKKLNEAAC